MTAAYSPAVDRHLSTLVDAPGPHAYTSQFQSYRLPPFARTLSPFPTYPELEKHLREPSPSISERFSSVSGVMETPRTPVNNGNGSEGEYVAEKAAFEPGVRQPDGDPATQRQQRHPSLPVDVTDEKMSSNGMLYTLEEVPSPGEVVDQATALDVTKNQDQIQPPGAKEFSKSSESYYTFSGAIAGLPSNNDNDDALAPPDAPSESSTAPGPQVQSQSLLPYNGNSSSRPASAFLPSTPKHPSVAVGPSARPDSRQDAPIVPASAGPSYRPRSASASQAAALPLPSMSIGMNVPISATARAIVQHPTYITPPSSPTPYAANPIYAYAGASPYPSTPATAGQGTTRASGAFAAQQQAQLMGMGVPPPNGIPPAFAVPDGREICVECAMRDQDMADVDVTSPGIWDRDSDVYYEELCRREAEEEEERMRARASASSSSEGHVVVRPPADHKRPRARGNRLTEQNLKLWLSMNPREPQARQQTLDLYVKTQTALLEAEALARARALQEARVLDNRVRDTYDHIRRSTFDVASNAAGMGSQTLVDEAGVIGTPRKKKPSHSPRRSASGPVISPTGGGALPLGSVVVDGPGAQHVRHQSKSHSREVTLLENGMIVEHVDVKREEKERRREEKRERERSRARKNSRSSGADVLSTYSIHGVPGTPGAQSPIPQADGTFYAQGERPMSRYSQASTRAMSVLTNPGLGSTGTGSAPPSAMPLTPPPSQGQGMGQGYARPPNARMPSQVSLADTQSISSASLSNRRSRFFAFKNWSEAWKSRESFAPSAVMSVSGSMMDMHLALDRENQNMGIHSAVEFGVNGPVQRPPEQWPRRSLSVDRSIMPMDGERPKKKKGLAKFWKIVTGGSKGSKNEAQRGREAQPVERSEDDAPLAPPPPLSYLVDRQPIARERSMSMVSATSARRVSTANVPNIIASPPLPTPTSIRNPWNNPSGGLSSHAEEPYNNGNGNGYLGYEDGSRGVHPVLSEPDMRQRLQEMTSVQASTSVTSRVPSSPRPISVYSLHKSLPPLPHEMPTPIDSPRPQTMYNLDSPTVKDGDESLFASPQPAFRREARRQSFGGTSSRPDLRTIQNGQSATYTPNSPSYAYADYAPYNELGASRSMGLLPDEATGSTTTLSIAKRRSKFGLASLLGKVKRSSESRPGSATGMVTARDAPELPASRPSESDVNLDGSVTEFGAPSSRSRHTNGGGQSRMSVASRKAIEELVDQDREFVAYRYPSVDQNISLLR